jgi:hypothetical protein
MRVSQRSWHFWVGEPVTTPGAALKKEMTDGGPRYGEAATLEDLQQMRNVLSFPPSLVSGLRSGNVSKSPTHFEIRGDTCRSSCIVLEGRDRYTIEDPGSRLRASSQIVF